MAWVICSCDWHCPHKLPCVYRSHGVRGPPQHSSCSGQHLSHLHVHGVQWILRCDRQAVRRRHVPAERGHLQHPWRAGGVLRHWRARRRLRPWGRGAARGGAGSGLLPGQGDPPEGLGGAARLPQDGLVSLRRPVHGLLRLWARPRGHPREGGAGAQCRRCWAAGIRRAGPLGLPPARLRRPREPIDVGDAVHGDRGGAGHAEASGPPKAPLQQLLHGAPVGPLPPLRAREGGLLRGCRP
mmetsp:Transcript_48296/g.149173  ORF Transcript_48296/g.149173 Transcript_48296/m.149173 type:complete len:240 (+) Transcript_48296:848-1567(+)